MALILLVFAYGLFLIFAAHTLQRRARIVALATAKCAGRDVPDTPEGRS